MKQRYRITGMSICLMIMVLAMALLATGNEFNIDLAGVLVMVVGGYGLRETLDHLGDGNSDKK